MRTLVLVFLAATACSGTEEHRCPAVGCAFGAMIRITPAPKDAVITVCRNAKCASATSTGVNPSPFEGDIYVQIMVEQLLLTSLAILVGLTLLVQLPITGVFGENLNWPLFLTAALGSMAIMAMVSVLCAVYPAWRASRLSPTEALHYE